jgi:membrane-bound metal-dependent hydrolase YbcI (DUF457 family)
MFAGHIGAALAIGRAERRVNIGVLVVAALLLDLILWTLILLGLEWATIPADFASTHQPAFVFPLSHGLISAVAWALLAAAAALFWYSKSGAAKFRIAAIIAIAVISHWLLDALVHAPELPLAGENSRKVGLGLWHSMPVALGVEALLVLLGLWLFLAGAPLSRNRKIGLALFALLILAFTVFGMTLAPPPPSVTAMAASSLVTLLVVCAVAAWLGKRTS